MKDSAFWFFATIYIVGVASPLLISGVAFLFKKSKSLSLMNTRGSTLKQTDESMQKALCEIKCALVNVLGNNIAEIYYKNLSDYKLTFLQFTNVCSMYETYKRLGGQDFFVDNIYSEICNEWEIES